MSWMANQASLLRVSMLNESEGCTGPDCKLAGVPITENFAPHLVNTRNHSDSRRIACFRSCESRLAELAPTYARVWRLETNS
jgi:hypothetical protein